MAYTTINKGSLYMNSKIYTGNGTADHAITGVGFQPDWVWIKNRGSANGHVLHDVIRGVTKNLETNSFAVENTVDPLSSFDSDGFTLSGTGGGINGNTENYASWNWLGGGTASSNTDGSITSSVSANTDSGFSVVTWTGTGANATVGHGLGVVPKITIVKGREAVTNWIVGGSLIVDVGGSTNNYILLNTEAPMDTSTTLYASYNTDTIGVKTDANINGSGQGMVMYCFSEVKGFSKFGSYTGNGSATDSPFIYTGFKPSFFMVKKTNGTGDKWVIIDNKRNPINGATGLGLKPDSSSVEDTFSGFNIDFLSNGFKPYSNWNGYNASGGSYIYMAFAENPLVGTNNVPATAR